MKHTLQVALVALSFLISQLSVMHVHAIVLDGVDYRIDTLQMFQAGPGTDYLQLRMFRTSDGNGRLDVYIFKTATQNPYVRFSHELGSGKVIGTERPTATAARKTTPTSIYFAGTNGSFFATTGDIGTPSGLTVSDGQICTNRSSMHNYPVAGFDANKLPHFGNAWSFTGRVYHGDDTLTIAHMNYKREADELVLYNQYNAATTLTNAYGTEVLLTLLPNEHWTTNGKVRAVVARKEVNIGDMAIPAGQAVLSGHGTAATSLNTFADGDTVTLGITLKLDGTKVALDEAASGSGSGHYMIIKDGVIRDPDMWAELHPRTAMGANQAGDTAIFCVVDGRGVSMGAKCKTVATIMQHYGAYNAVNWDGGGSSCMYIRQFGQVNKGSDGTERACGNSMFVVADVPTDDQTIARIAPYWVDYRLPRYGVYEPKFLGYNQYDVLIDTDVQGVTLSCDPAVGYVLDGTRFVASGADGGLVTASFGNISTTINVHLLKSAEVAFRLDSVLLNGFKPYKMEVQSVVGNSALTVLSDALVWQSLDPSICEVSEAGVITGVSNGVTQVVGSLGTYADTIQVRVENPEEHDFLFNDMLSPSEWTLSASAGYNPAWRVADDAIAAIDFTYAVGRQPFVNMAFSGQPLYSLPDTLRIPFTTDAQISKVTMNIRPNNAKSATTLTLLAEGVPAAADAVAPYSAALVVPVEETFGSDHAIYPLYLDFIKFWLNTKTSTGAHYILFDGVHLIYTGARTSDLVGRSWVGRGSSEPLKVLRDGQVLILRDGHIYNSLGQVIE